MAQQQWDPPSPTAAPSLEPGIPTSPVLPALAAEQGLQCGDPVAAQSCSPALTWILWAAGQVVDGCMGDAGETLNQVKIYLARQIFCQGSASMTGYKYFL